MATGVGTVSEQSVMRLPEAPVEQYFEWVRWWRDVEARMAANRSLEELASRESAPFLEGPLAEFSSRVVTHMLSQARAARRGGRPSFAPQIPVQDPALAAAAVQAARRRGAWLSRERVLEAMGVKPLSPEVARLRERALDEAERQFPPPG